MQGRLVPPENGRIQAFPRNNWRKEFEYASKAGLTAIEWIFDVFGEDINPLSTPLGIEEIKLLSQSYSVVVRSICADYFMEKMLLRVSATELNNNVKKLEWLLSQAALLDVKRIVLPFVDSSAIKTEQEKVEVVKVLFQVLPMAEKLKMDLHLETALNPEEFKKLMDNINHPLVKINYDSGNSSSLGYKVEDEFKAYGNYIGSIHIKDRVYGGTTVPLGSGDAQLENLFNEIKKLNYHGDFILQVARDIPGDEINWAIHNLAYVHKLINTLTL